MPVRAGSLVAHPGLRGRRHPRRWGSRHFTLTFIRLGVCFYNLDPAEIVGAAVAAEDLGLHTLWLGEHVVLSPGYASVHPSRTSATEKSDPIVASDTVLVDPMVMAGAVLSSTSQVHFGTGVYLGALRHPLLTARAAATAARLSAGRFVLGLGAGWLEEEFESLGVAFGQWGERLAEAIEIVGAALAGGTFSYRGRHWSFSDVQITDLPIDVPVVIGGNSPAALTRAARLGDGWYNSGGLTGDDLERARGTIEAARSRFGRERVPFRYWVRPPELDLSVSERLAGQGFTDQVVWGDKVWPDSPGLSPVDKMHIMRGRLDQLGLSALIGGTRERS